MKAISEEIYGKSMQATYLEKYIQWVTKLSLTIPVYLHSFSSFCLPNLRNDAEIPQNSPKTRAYNSSGSSKVIDLVLIESAYATFYYSVTLEHLLKVLPFRVIDALCSKLTFFSTPPFFDAS